MGESGDGYPEGSWEEYGAAGWHYDDNDELLVEMVADRLVADVRVRGRRMRVAVQNGVVILEGRVDSPEAKTAAGKQAWATPGVVDVCNMLVPETRHRRGTNGRRQ